MSIYKTIEIEKILPPTDALRHHDVQSEDIRDLATDLELNGMDTPVLVINNGSDTFILNDGSRRLTAATLLMNEGRSVKGLPVGEVAVRVIGEIADWDSSRQLMNQMRLNAQALETSPKDYFQACLRLAANGLTISKIAESINKPSSLVSSWLKALALPEEIRCFVEDGTISLASGKILVDSKKYFTTDELVEVAEEAKTMSALELSAYIAEELKEKEEAKKANPQGKAEPKEVVFTLTPILLGKNDIQIAFEKAQADYESTNSAFNEGVVEAFKIIYSIDAESETLRRNKFEKAIAEKAATSAKKKEENLLKTIGVRSAEYIKEHGREAFDALIVASDPAN